MKIKNGKIYKITNTINGKVYIGLTTEPISVRWSGHVCWSKKDNNIYLYNSMKKHGIENFKIEAIKTGITSLRKLHELEKHYIKEFDSFNNGYNLTIGGEGTVGYKHTKETLRKLRNAKLGKKLSPEHRKKSIKILNEVRILAAESNKKRLSIPIVQIDKKTDEVINLFDSIVSAERFLKVRERSGSINKVLKGERKTAHGYKWKRQEEN